MYTMSWSAFLIGGTVAKFGSADLLLVIALHLSSGAKMQCGCRYCGRSTENSHHLPCRRGCKRTASAGILRWGKYVSLERQVELDIADPSRANEE